jgi:hypothetical protein
MKSLVGLFLLFCFYLFWIALCWALPVSLVAIWTRHEVSTWATFVQDKPVDIAYWQAWLISIPWPIVLLGDAVSCIIRLVQGI